MDHTSTREHWHALAEHVLAASLYAHTGRIGLRVTSGGFATPVFDVNGAFCRIAVIGGHLVYERSDGVDREEVTTLRRAAEFVHGPLGAPADVYTPATPLDPDAPLRVDVTVASALAEWFATGRDALRDFAARHVDDAPTPVQLWPEHFDLALSAAEVNYGVSPGDAGRPDPYAYVGPWQARQGPFWNEPYGAARSRAELPTAPSVVEFFERGRALTVRDQA